MLCHQASWEMLEMGKQRSIKAHRELSSQWLHFANEKLTPEEVWKVVQGQTSPKPESKTSLFQVRNRPWYS